MLLIMMPFGVLITDMMIICGAGANENENIRLGRVRFGKVMTHLASFGMGNIQTQ